MVTFNIEQCAVGDRDSDSLSAPSERALEAATQTYAAGEPIRDNAAGFIAVFVEAGTDLLGISALAGSNGAAAGDETAKYVSLIPRGRVIYCNLLEAAGANHTMVDADAPGKAVGFAVDTIGGNVIWHAEDAGLGYHIVSRKGDHMAVDATNNVAVTGDINARVQIVPDADVLATQT